MQFSPPTPPSRATLKSLTYMIRLNSQSQPKVAPARKKPKIKVKKYKAPKEVKSRIHTNPEKAVYFIVVGDTVKIGISKDISKRLASLKTGLSSPIDTVYVEENAGRLSESALHAKFHSHRLHGEWFSLSDEIKEFIAECRLTASLSKFL